MAQGYIKLHRQLKENWLWKESRTFSKAEAWIDLLLTANHKDAKFVLGNELIDIKRGELITSELKLMEHWKWSKTKVRGFLELLQNDQMIVKKSDNKKTTITIVNYDIYQCLETAKEPEKNRKPTAKRPQKNTNNNDNNDNNEKNEKKKYADFVTMTEEEYNKLVEQFGEQGTKDRIENLNLYKGSKGVTYKSDYMTVLNWDRKNKKEPAKSILPPTQKDETGRGARVV